MDGVILDTARGGRQSFFNAGLRRRRRMEGLRGWTTAHTYSRYMEEDGEGERKEEEGAEPSDSGCYITGS